MELKQIPREELVHGRFYLGRGRNGNVGRWDEKSNSFLVPSWKFDLTVVKHEGYYDPENGCFQPFLLIEEGEMGDTEGYSSRYGGTLILG